MPVPPWARVEGAFRVGADPVSNVVLSLRDGGIRSSFADEPHIVTRHEVTTGGDGKFVFDRMFPGKGRIGRLLDWPNGDAATEVTSSEKVPAEFIAGRTTRLDLGGVGRPVIGTLVRPHGVRENVDWRFAMVQAMGVVDRPAAPVPPADVQNDPEAYDSWWKEWQKTTEGKAWLANHERLRFEAPFIQASVDRDGRFRMDDVPSGEYNLVVGFVMWRQGGQFTSRFRVPPIEGGRSEVALDLGVLQLE